MHKDGVHSYAGLQEEHVAELAWIHEVARRYFQDRSREKQSHEHPNTIPKLEDKEKFSTQGNYFSFTR